MADVGLYGHPFRALWQQLAGDLGITTGRMRENALDQQADQETQLRSANMAIAQAMQGGDEEENAILAQMMRDRAQVASQNIAAIQRGQAPQPTTGAAALVAPFYQQREQGRIAAETDAQNKLYELAKQRRDEFHTEITGEQKKIDSAQAEGNTVLKLLNDLGADSDVVQSRFRDFTGMSLGDSKDGELGTIGVHGLGHFDLGSLLGISSERKASYDEITKGVAAIIGTQTDAAQKRIAALQHHAVAAGYSLDPETGGLQDLNIPQYEQGTTKPRAPNASDTLTSPPSLYDRLAEKLEPVSTRVANAAEAVGNVVQGATDIAKRAAPIAGNLAAQSLPGVAPVMTAMQLLNALRANRAKREKSQRPVNP
jgi:hypothetical protein